MTEILELDLSDAEEADSDMVFYEVMLLSEQAAERGVSDASICVALFEALRLHLQTPEVH